MRSKLRNAVWKTTLVAVGVLICPPVWAGVVDFEDVGATLAPNSYWNGSPNDGHNTFTSHGFVFHNNYTQAWDVWDGFAYSNKTDTTTPGHTNQYSAITGSGAGGSPTYGVSFVNLWGDLPKIDVPAGVALQSMQVTNTTYAYLSMKNGDDFAKKFGGSSGNDPDWFKLTIYGKDLANQVLGTVEFYLADFRFADNTLDYIVNWWATVDLTPISSARILEFSLDSSDVGPWGMNTPAYFALDNIVFQTLGGGAEVVPEPASLALLASGLAAAGAGAWLRRRKRAGAQQQAGTRKRGMGIAEGTV
ncbi:MAG: DUF4465 domain-containing protein [Thermogutta sp.]|uniref:DUF4465 domain-containing protein n=1 Tax=Thermogutta sp. TaxID=1962930 RepID=UPI0019CB72B3|nr:DUF4465 domain-containing protein [Thermogutta sp.]MBC7354240.1 DUF4465 domain-containing protein [Thermogutta sp.]